MVAMIMGCPFVSQTLVATRARAREAVTDSNFVFLIAMQDGQGLAPEYIKALSIYGCIGLQFDRIVALLCNLRVYTDCRGQIASKLTSNDLYSSVFSYLKCIWLSTCPEYD